MIAARGGRVERSDLGVHERLDRLFAGLRPRSYVSLKQALDIKDTDGVAATLIIQIPAAADKPPEVYITTAPAQLITDLTKGT